MISLYQATHLSSDMREHLRARYTHPIRTSYRFYQNETLWEVDGAIMTMLVNWSKWESRHGEPSEEESK